MEKTNAGKKVGCFLIFLVYIELIFFIFRVDYLMWELRLVSDSHVVVCLRPNH